MKSFLTCWCWEKMKEILTNKLGSNVNQENEGCRAIDLLFFFFFCACPSVFFLLFPIARCLVQRSPHCPIPLLLCKLYSVDSCPIDIQHHCLTISPVPNNSNYLCPFCFLVTLHKLQLVSEMGLQSSLFTLKLAKVYLLFIWILLT